MKKICLLFWFSIVLSLFVCIPNIGTAKGDDVSNVSGNQHFMVLASFNLKCRFPEVTEKMMVYRTVDPNISRDDILSLMKIFGLDGQIIDQGRQFIAKDGDKVLEVFKQSGTGYLRFSDDAKLAIEKKAENLPSKDEAVAKANDFLKNNGLLPSNTFLAGVVYYEFEQYDSEGKAIDQGKTALSVGFGFKINEMKVEGPGAKVSIVFGESGEIIETAKIWREIKPDKEARIITPQEAFARFKERWPTEAKPNELEQAKIKTEVNIREVYVTYYAEPGCIPQSYIEPVYVFVGDYQTSGIIGNQEIMEGDHFKIIVSAIHKE
jgi:hypothetical protein